MTGGWMTVGGWVTGGRWVAHPTASNMIAMISDLNFTVPILAPLTPCARRRYRCAIVGAADKAQRHHTVI
jgi:hypothetical protein